MTIENLERVMWRLRDIVKASHQRYPNNYHLRRAIMMEIGTDPRTIRSNRKALIELGWIKTVGTSYIKLTNEDVSG